MRTMDIYNNVCGRINEIDKLLQVTISWSRVMQLNPDTTINGENGDSISEKWETMAKGIKDLAEDIDTLKQEEMLQAADMIAELRKKFRIIEKRKNKRTKAFDIYIERETSHEIREQKCHIHDYWQYIYEDMQLVIDTLYDTQRSRYGATPLPTAEKQHKKSGRNPYTPESFFNLFTPKVKDKDAFIEALKAVIDNAPHRSNKGAYMYKVVWTAWVDGFLCDRPSYQEVTRSLGIKETDTDLHRYNSLKRTMPQAINDKDEINPNTKRLIEEIAESLKKHLQEAET